ncbi:hypothetical protein K3165_03230 [Qipengyuania sp. 1XM1-15A]|uniref:hypothetical protein n=1 Tax=Qipengyuania xiamenensis TaxID=2867237 RepID=UPI001C86DB3B|nr:hypothetical protein [Qipengyuania xiamenensis]MBX7531935.1 hypothetical protein [Qipengyuania xiamenensis]
MARITTRKERIQVALLLGTLCIFAFVLQNLEGWHAKGLDDAEFEIITGEVVSINLIPSNTGTSYLTTVLTDDGYRTQLVTSPNRARECPVGAKVEVARRGLDHRWTKRPCAPD